MKNYEFELGEINDELVEEYKVLALQYCKQLNNTDMIGSKIARGEMELTDDLVFLSAIFFAKEYLTERFNRGK